MNLTLSLFSCLAGACLAVSTVAGAADQPPNILFIFADDLAYDALGTTGDGSVQTPHLDKLRDQGCCFEQVFNPGSWTPAICQASRTMLNTGKTVWKAAKYNRAKDKTPLWPELMHQGGYETYFTGKWHVKSVSSQQVFDHVGTERGGMPEQTQLCYDRKFIPGKPDAWRPDDQSQGGYWKGGKHWSEVVADEACGFLKQAGKSDKPFFMYVAFNAPHDPHQSYAKYLNKYPVDKIKLPETFMPEYPYCKGIGAGPKLRDEWLAPFPRTPLSIKTNRREYYSMITHMDDQIGRILDTLTKTIKTPTYVIFTADQGIAMGDHGMIGKQNMYEPAIRVPFFIVGPGIKRNSTVKTPIYVQSIMPTTLELAGIPKQDHIAYPSLTDELHGKQVQEQNIYGSYMATQRMIRTSEWKMLIYPKINRVRLFNRKDDPVEMKDLAENPASIPTMKKLFAELKKLQKAQNDTMNLEPSFNAFIQSIPPQS